MQYAPSRIQAPQNSVNESALAQITGQQVQGLNQLGDAFKQFGTGNRSRDVAALIGSGQLDGLTEAQARSKIAQLTGGGVSKESQSSIDSLLGNKSSSESAKLIADAKVESQGRDIGSSESLQTAQIAANKANLGLQLTSAEKIALSNNKASMARTEEIGLQKSSNRTLDELFQRKQSDDLFKKQVALEQIKKTPAKPDYGTAPAEGVKKIIESGGSGDITQRVADKISDEIDSVLDLSFDPKSKKIAQDSIATYLSTEEGQANYLTGGVDAVISHLSEVGDFGTEFTPSQFLPFGREANERTFKLKKK